MKCDICGCTLNQNDIFFTRRIGVYICNDCHNKEEYTKEKKTGVIDRIKRKILQGVM